MAGSPGGSSLTSQYGPSIPASQTFAVGRAGTPRLTFGSAPSPPALITPCSLLCSELLRSLSFPLFRLPASLLPIAFTGQGLLDAEFLARLQVKKVPLDRKSTRLNSSH